jgi:hypothetical protein
MSLVYIAETNFCQAAEFTLLRYRHKDEIKSEVLKFKVGPLDTHECSNAGKPNSSRLLVASERREGGLLTCVEYAGHVVSSNTKP